MRVMTSLKKSQIVQGRDFSHRKFLFRIEREGENEENICLQYYVKVLNICHSVLHSICNVCRQPLVQRKRKCFVSMFVSYKCCVLRLVDKCLCLYDLFTLNELWYLNETVIFFKCSKKLILL